MPTMTNVSLGLKLGAWYTIQATHVSAGNQTDPILLSGVCVSKKLESEGRTMHPTWNMSIATAAGNAYFLNFILATDKRRLKLVDV